MKSKRSSFRRTAKSASRGKAKKNKNQNNNTLLSKELHNTNENLQNRNDGLSTASSDLVDLLGSVNIPILMLSNELRIRRFTPSTGLPESLYQMMGDSLHHSSWL